MRVSNIVGVSNTRSASTVYAMMLAFMATFLILSGPALAGEGNADQTPGATGATNPGTVDDATLKQTAKAFVKVRQIVHDEQQALTKTNDDAQKQKIATDAESSKVEAVKAEGLQPQQYNQVIQLAQADKTVQQKFLSYVKDMIGSPGGAE